MPGLSQATQRLIQKYQAWHQSLQPKTNVATINVDEVASTVASFYEKIRGVVDWREEHLLRRSAIERILKRRLFLQTSAEETVEPFVLELIRGGHFPNNQIEEKKIEEVKNALNKYLFILKSSSSQAQEKMGVQLYNWLLNIAACEVEEILCPSQRETALVEYMTELMKERIEIKGMVVIGDKEKETQIYIAVQRALFKMDNPFITYSLLKRRYLDWPNLSPAQAKEIADNIYSIWQSVDKELRHPLTEKFYRICEKYDTSYLILGDIISPEPSEVSKKLADPESLESTVRDAYKKRLSKLKSRVSRAAIYSTISIFITKMVLAFAVEIQVDKWLAIKYDWLVHEFSWQTVIFNILIPPLLMFLLVLTIRPPKKENLDRVIMEAVKIVYDKKQKDTYAIKMPRKKGVIIRSIIFLFYLATFIVSFGFIYWVLYHQLRFSILSIIIFLMFLSLISFAGVKIRERSKELQIIEEKSRFLSFIADSFSLPFVRVGKWLSGKLAKYNVVLIIITALLDMPFQLFTEFIEHWRSFLKEKKEEIH